MPNLPNTHAEMDKREHYVRAAEVASRYGVSSRYVLLLAAKGAIPCLRLGPQCVRFSLSAVAEAIEGPMAHRESVEP